MSDCIITRRGGSSSELVVGTFTANGTYSPPSGKDGFSSVVVDTPGTGELPQLYSSVDVKYHLGDNLLEIYDSQDNGAFTDTISLYKDNVLLSEVSMIEGIAIYEIVGIQAGDTIKAINHNRLFEDSDPFIHVMQNTDIGLTLFTDDFESYIENTTISSGTTPYTVIYNGSGDGNQKIIASIQLDGERGQVLQLQGRSSWGSRIRHTISDFDTSYRYVAVECDFKPVSGSTPGGFGCGSNNASGTWTKAVFGIDFSNSKVYLLYNDSSTQIQGVTYTVDTWYHIKLVLDTQAHLQYAYIDDVCINPNGSTASSAVTQWLDFVAGNSGTNTSYFDNVSLYEYA